MKTVKDEVLELAQILEDSKGNDIRVIDVSELNSWTDYFIIVTVNSNTQSQGMLKLVKDYVKDSNNLEIHLTNHKIPDGEDWNLIDLGPIVVHVMTQEARLFYDLEKLWHAGVILR